MKAHKPLEGKRIVVTRAPEQAEELCAKLRAQGAQPVQWPMIAIAPPEDFAPLDEAIRHLPQYDWIVFSSANGVQYFWNRIDDCQMRFPRIAAVGEKTAQALRHHGLRVDVVPQEFLASHIAEALGDVAQQKILVLRPNSAPPDLVQSLAARGAQVSEVVAYRTVPVRCEQPFDFAEVDAITFASGSAAKNFATQLNGLALPERVCVACIGPSTAQAAQQAGLPLHVEATLHTLDGLVSALADHFAQEVIV